MKAGNKQKRQDLIVFHLTTNTIPNTENYQARKPGWVTQALFIATCIPNSEPIDNRLTLVHRKAVSLKLCSII